ncbi:Thioredoxin-dependent peroxide reductase, mitochondrial [Fukomys damarensis]|uniref:Thioredoxin-dependent peroxide reductase, mitochondrial n=1 Tax=Fukomys damarensis TaxID=885580 RepID=A0A091EMC8_FUKDA|nr:Thioredoxin-dependent peroxide reductase, mitochondrial [Fukomys damarensis]
MAETLCLVKAFQFVDTRGEVCPANLTPDFLTIKPNPTASEEYFEKVLQQTLHVDLQLLQPDENCSWKDLGLSKRIIYRRQNPLYACTYVYYSKGFAFAT